MSAEIEVRGRQRARHVAAGALVRDDACAAAGVVGAAPARWRGGDRLSAAGQRRGRWAPHDRRPAWSPRGDRARAGYGRSRAGPRRCTRRRCAGSRALNLAREPARPAGSPLADAVEAIGSAVRECRLHLGIRAGPWELAVALTGGLLCDGPSATTRRSLRRARAAAWMPRHEIRMICNTQAYFANSRLTLITIHGVADITIFGVRQHRVRAMIGRQGAWIVC